MSIRNNSNNNNNNNNNNNKIFQVKVSFTSKNQNKGSLLFLPSKNIK